MNSPLNVQSQALTEALVKTLEALKFTDDEKNKFIKLYMQYTWEAVERLQKDD